MADTQAETVPAHGAFKVLAALAELGEATAAAVAEHAGLGYSTTTPKLRAWEGSGQAERFRTEDGRTLWRLTDAGRAATATTATTQPAAADTPDPTADPAADEERNPASGGPAAAAAADTPQPASSDAPPQPHTDPDVQPSPGPARDTTGDPAPEEQADGPDGPATPSEERPARARRSGGSLRGAILDILEAHPDRQYRTGELCRLIDAANDGSGAAKASAGAVANAATKLVADGKAVQTVERPATYQLAPGTGGE